MDGGRFAEIANRIRDGVLLLPQDNEVNVQY